MPNRGRSSPAGLNCGRIGTSFILIPSAKMESLWRSRSAVLTDKTSFLAWTFHTRLCNINTSYGTYTYAANTLSYCSIRSRHRWTRKCRGPECNCEQFKAVQCTFNATNQQCAIHFISSRLGIWYELSQAQGNLTLATCSANGRPPSHLKLEDQSCICNTLGTIIIVCASCL